MNSMSNHKILFYDQQTQVTKTASSSTQPNSLQAQQHQTYLTQIQAQLKASSKSFDELVAAGAGIYAQQEVRLLQQQLKGLYSRALREGPTFTQKQQVAVQKALKVAGNKEQISSNSKNSSSNRTSEVLPDINNDKQNTAGSTNLNQATLAVAIQRGRGQKTLINASKQIVDFNKLQQKSESKDPNLQATRKQNIIFPPREKDEDLSDDYFEKKQKDGYES